MDGLKATLSFDAFAYDYDDEYLTIDTDTHTININNVSRLFGVQYDGNSKLIKFRIRNKLSDIQKMQDSIVYINWIDSKGVKGQSIAINKTINNDTCEFAWKVPFDALKNSGVLHFAMSAVMTKNSSSVIDQRWSTQIASVITPDGIYIKSYTPSSEEEDRIAQIYNELSNIINKQNDNLQSQVNSLKEDSENYVYHNIGYEISKTGAWLNSTGNEIEAGGWSVSDFIKISVGNTYTINGITTPTTMRKYALYDKNRIFTRYIENNVNEHSVNVEPTYNECYIRLSIRYDDALKILTARNPSKNDYRINDKLNVKYFGAVGDGSVDDTNIIQYVLNLAEKTNTSVYLPSGKYLITSLEIPANVTLIGENGKMSSKMLGSVLYCTDRNNPAIILNSCSTIKNIAFFYPNQRIVNDYPVTYPETIKLSDTSTTTLIEIDNINLINSYYAINATPKHEKLRVNNVWGYAINKGLFIDGSTDVDIVNNVHFNYNTLRGFYDESVNEEFESFTAKVGIAFQFGRCDTAIIQNIFAYGYRIGLQLITSVTAANKLPPTYTIFTNISMDTCNYPLWIGNASHVLFDNFVGVSKNHTGDYSDVKACVYIAGGDGICMSNSILTGYGNMINSSGSDILLSNCNIRNFNRAEETGFVIETSNSDIAVNNSLIIGSINRITGFIHGSSNANSITVTGCIIKNITMQGKLIQVDNVDTIVTQGLNTLINSDSVTN